MMPRIRSRRSIAPLALAALALGAGPAAAQTDDDLFLFTSNYPPNVVLLQDNSVSMNEIEWHPAFDPNDTPACSFWDNATTYTVASTTLVAGLTTIPPKVPSGSQTLAAAQIADTDCHNTRSVYSASSATYSGLYLNWYFSNAADPYVTEISTAVHTFASCNQPSCSGCYDKYRRTRNQMAKAVLFDVLCRAEPTGVRFGHAFYRAAANSPANDPNGGWIGLQVDHPNPGHANNLEAHIKNMGSSVVGTPLAETLFTIYSYYMSRNTANIPLGVDAATKFPKYSFRESTGAFSNNNVPDSPVEAACQKNFVIMVTSGKPTRDDFDVEDATNTAQGFANFGALIGDFYADGETELPGDAAETSWYLDDVAKYMHDHDFRPDFAGDQTIDTYTIGLNVDASTNAFLHKTSEEVGGGLNFYVRDGDELAAALISALNSILEKAQSFTAATVPSSRTAAGGEFFTTYFLPSGRRAFWEGSLRAWHITAEGDILDANGDCALVDPDAGECNSGPFDPYAVPYWEAANEMPLPDARNLYSTKLLLGTPTMVDFDDSLTAADLGLQAYATPGSPPDPTPNSSLYLFAGSTAINEEGLADEVVQFARGCSFGTGVETGDVDAGGVACAVRGWRLGDIFHSNPIVVGAPRTVVSDASFFDFKASFLDRKRVLYAGTNAGFLTAFDAGDWDAAATPPKYDVSTGGAELFGFMPWQARQNIKNQPIDSPTDRTYYVDGSPQVADAWLYPTAGTLTKSASDWRTVLVGGLRQGGRQYYALDVTDPSGATSSYPGYLWEFPREDDPDDPSTTGSFLPWMGETWGQPIITRVRVDYNGDTVERWVAVVTGGYAEEGDPNNAAYDAEDLAGRGIFLLDLKTGEVLAEHKYDNTGSCAAAYNAATPDRFLCFATAATPAVFDIDFDGFTDVIYLGDLGGNVWKWAISDVGEDRVNDGSGLRTQPAWEFGRFFKAPAATTTGPNGTFYKSFFTTPAGALEGGRLYIALGSGQRSDLGFDVDAGWSAAEKASVANRYYVLIDTDPHEAVSGIPAQEETDTDGAGPLQALTNVTSSTACNAISPPGYFFTVGEGEKFVTRSEIFAGYVIAATFEPSASIDTCTARGTSQLYAFRLGCGQGYFTDASNNPDRNIDIGAGFPTDPQTSIGVGGTDNRIYIQKSGSDLQSFEASDVDVGGHLLYWRETP